MSDGPRIICGFPGIGKSFVVEKREGYVDSDSSKFSWLKKGVRNPDFPANYIEHIKKQSGVVLCSTHKEVREALTEAGMEYWLCYPARFLQVEYMARYVKRGSPKAFVEFMDENWDKFITEMEEDMNGRTARKVVMFSEDYLNDILHYFED